MNVKRSDVTVSLRLHPEDPEPILVVKGNEKTVLPLIEASAPNVLAHITAAAKAFVNERGGGR